LSIFTASMTMTGPAINRIETVGSPNLQGRVGTPFLMPGIAKDYWIYGPWLDYTSKVTLAGVVQTKENIGWPAQYAPGVKVHLKVPSGTSRGIRKLRITIGCNGMDLVSDCVNKTFERDLMVLQSGFVNTVAPSTGIPVNQQVTLTIAGSNLSHAGIIRNRTMFVGTSTSNKLDGSFQMTGYTSQCGTAVIMVGDEAEGGDVYPYGSVSVKTTATCGYTPPPTTLRSGSGCPTGQTFNTQTGVCQDE
jgi:hypothetical protein